MAFRQTFDMYVLTIGYWLEGADWKEAKKFARFIVKGWRRH